MISKDVTQYQIVDVGWSFRLDVYTQYIKLQSRGKVTELPIKDFPISVRLSEHRFCPGYFLNGHYFQCKNHVDLSGTPYEMCKSCDTQLGFRDAFLFGKAPNENMRKHLSQPHFIYLAWFYPEVIKVGTAAQSRKHIRPIEQDALVYTFIASSSGIHIQFLEKEISKRAGLTEFVKSKNKLPYFHIKTKSKEPLNAIKSHSQRVKKLFEDDSDYKDWFLKDFEIVDLRSRKEIYYPSQEVRRVSINELGFELKGTIKGLRGKFVLLQNGQYDLAVSKSNLIGRYIEEQMQDFSVYNLKQGEQIGLF